MLRLHSTTKAQNMTTRSHARPAGRPIPTRRRRMVALTVGLVAALTAVDPGAALAAAGSTDDVAPVDEQVAIGPSREMHLECSGRGRPTVVLIAGGVNSGAIWSMPYDFARPTPTVFPQVSTFTRVCAYDRPNTASPAPDDAVALGTSTPTTGSVTPANGVVDLQRLLRAASVRGPYVLVGHSYGGLIARLYASTYPKEVAGLVLIDSPSEVFFDRLTVAQQEMWVRASSGEAAFPGAESFNFPAAFAEMRAARKEPRVSTVMFTSDEPFDYSAAVTAGTLGPEFTDFGPLSFRAHVAAQRELAKRLGAKLVLDTDSGHYIFVEHPKLVVKAIRRVVKDARR
jgi:pimeloyl-ACP methyl ester carboxylesterase